MSKMKKKRRQKKRFSKMVCKIPVPSNSFATKFDEHNSRDEKKLLILFYKVHVRCISIQKRKIMKNKIDCFALLYVVWHSTTGKILSRWLFVLFELYSSSFMTFVVWQIKRNEKNIFIRTQTGMKTESETLPMQK